MKMCFTLCCSDFINDNEWKFYGSASKEYVPYIIRNIFLRNTYSVSRSVGKLMNTFVGLCCEEISHGIGYAGLT